MARLIMVWLVLVVIVATFAGSTAAHHGKGRHPTFTPTTAPPTATIPASPVATTPAPTSTMPPITPTATAVPNPPTNQPALVHAYWLQQDSGSPSYNLTRYMPRQFEPGAVVFDAAYGNFEILTTGVGQGCDVFPSLNMGRMRVTVASDVHTFAMNRAATVYVVNRTSLVQSPQWIRDLSNVGTMTVKRSSTGAVYTYNLFETSAAAGTATFGGASVAGESKDLPWFVFCEANGSPSGEPITPAGLAVPVANQYCPAWVHDQYGDGWHAQIDPVYWCYFGHEHGSDPAWFDPSYPPPVFNQTATMAGGSENHVGFKVYVFDDLNGRYRYRILHHFGTAGQARACAEFHTVEVVIKDLTTGAIVADVRFMGDYGESRNTDTNVPLTPSQCPDQAATSTGTGVRLIPVGPTGTGYEPWRFDQTGNVLGMLGGFTINTGDQITHCNDNACSAVTVRNDIVSGTARFWTDADLGWVAPRHSLDGRFCTDAMAMAVVDCAASGALPQFVALGFSINPLDNALPGGGTGGHMYNPLAWGYPMFNKIANPGPAERENSIPPGASN
jgi:hypothetical protein